MPSLAPVTSRSRRPSARTTRAGPSVRSRRIATSSAAARARVRTARRAEAEALDVLQATRLSSRLQRGNRQSLGHLILGAAQPLRQRRLRQHASIRVSSKSASSCVVFDARSTCCGHRLRSAGSATRSPRAR